MYMPSIFGESLFDDMFPFDDSFFASKKNPLYGKNASRVMKTDIKENLLCMIQCLNKVRKRQ